MVVTSAKPKVVTILQWVHLGIFLISIIVIFLLHYYPYQFFDFLRLPTFLKDIDIFLGFGWPASLHVYQAVLIFFIFVAFVDSLGLLFYSHRFWRLISDLFSFLGFLIILPVSFFFIFTLAAAEGIGQYSIKTAIVYFVISFLIFVLDFVTWFVDERSFLKRKG